MASNVTVREQLGKLLELSIQVFSGQNPDINNETIGQRVMDFATGKFQAAVFRLDSERFDSTQRSYDQLWPVMEVNSRVANGMPGDSLKAKYCFALEFCRKFFASEALTAESLDDALAQSSVKAMNVDDVAIDQLGDTCLAVYAEDLRRSGETFTCDFQNIEGMASHFYDSWVKNQRPDFQAQIISTQKGALVMSAEMIAEESESHNYLGRYYVFSTVPCFDDASFKGAEDLKKGPFVMTFGNLESALDFIKNHVQHTLLADPNDATEEVRFQRLVNVNEQLPTYCEAVAQMLQSDLSHIEGPIAKELQEILNQIQRYLRNHQWELSKKYAEVLKGNNIPLAEGWLSPIASPRKQQARKNQALFRQLVQQRAPATSSSSSDRVKLDPAIFPLLTNDVPVELSERILNKLAEHGLYNRFIVLALSQQVNDGGSVNAPAAGSSKALENLKILVSLLTETLRQTDENALARLKSEIRHVEGLDFENGLDAFVESLGIKYDHDFELPAKRQLERANGNPELQALIFLQLMEELDGDLVENGESHSMKVVQVGDRNVEEELESRLEDLLKKHDLLERYAALHLPNLEFVTSVEDVAATLGKTLESTAEPKDLRRAYFDSLSEAEKAKVRAFSYTRQLTGSDNLVKFDEEQVTDTHSSFMNDLEVLRANRDHLGMLESTLTPLLEAEGKLNAFYGAIYKVAVDDNENPSGDDYGKENAFTDAVRSIKAVERLLDGPGTMGDQYPELNNFPEFSELAALEVPENPDEEILSRIEAELSKDLRLNAKFRAIENYDDQDANLLTMYARAKSDSEEDLLKMLEEKTKPILGLVQKLNDFYGQIYAVQARKEQKGWDGGFGYGEREAFTDIVRTVEALRRTLEPTVAEEYPQLVSIVEKAQGTAFEAQLKELANSKFIEEPMEIARVNVLFSSDPKWEAALYIANEDFETGDFRKVLAGLEQYLELDDDAVLDQLKSKVSQRLQHEGRWVAFHGQIYEVEKRIQEQKGNLDWDPKDFNFGGNNAFNDLYRTVEALKCIFNPATV